MTDDSAGRDDTDNSQSGDGLPDGIPDPDNPPDFEDDPHVLPPEDLQYPTLSAEDGQVSPADGFDLSEDLDRDGMGDWLDALSDALVSHDIAVEGDDRRATLGIAPDGVDLTFDPDEDQRGQLEVTFTLDAKVMRYEDADERPRGARGNRGFIPIEMLTGDQDADSFRCYNWVGDPTAGLDGEETDIEEEDG